MRRHEIHSADALPSILTTEGRGGSPRTSWGWWTWTQGHSISIPQLSWTYGGFYLFFFLGGCSFCQSSVSAWEVLSGDAENNSACHQGALRQVLRWGSVFPAPCSALVRSRCGLRGLPWDLVLAPSTRSSLRPAGWGGSDPWDCPPFICSSQVQAVTCASDPWGQIGDFHDPFLGFD